MNEMDRVLKIERAMTEQERAVFLAAFTKLNPSWRGAQVADVLQVLGDSDSHLAVVEPMYATYKNKVWDQYLIAPATRAVFYLHGPEGVTWERVSELIGRTETL